MTSLFGDFETELAMPDALTACVEALDGLGWQVDSVEAQRVECKVTSGPGDGGATIEVELTETDGGSDIRLIGSDSEEAKLEEQELGAVMDQARDAIGERIDKVEVPAAVGAQTAVKEEEPAEQPAEQQETDAQGQWQEEQDHAPEQKPEEPEQKQEEPDQEQQELPPAGWFPDPHGGEQERYWDGENWTEHFRPTGDEAQPATGEDGDSRRWLPQHWQTIAVGVLVFCAGGAIGAFAKPEETKQATKTVQGPAEVRTVTQTQTVNTPAPDQASSGVAGAAASSPNAKASRGSAASSPAVDGGTVSQCDPSYAPICLKPSVPDYDCLGDGDGPKYVDGPLTVVGNDHWELDEADNDGVACE